MEYDDVELDMEYSSDMRVYDPDLIYFLFPVIF